MTRLLRITSHAGHARYLHTVADAGYIVRQPSIPSPYAFSPTHAVYMDARRGLVIIVETAHKRYDVFAVDSHATPVYATDEAATEAYISSLRAARTA